jgi:VIT1/CCC1 family predicted Fe2+/Mn2+ transporter
VQFLKFRKGPASLPLIRLAIFAMHLLRDQGRPVGRAALRVTIGGGMAMAVTAVIGRLLGVSVN